MTIKEIRGELPTNLTPDESKRFQVRCYTCGLPLFPKIGLLHPYIIRDWQSRIQCARLNATLHEKCFGEDHLIIIEEKDPEKDIILINGRRPTRLG